MYYFERYPEEEHKIRFDRPKLKGICGLAEDGHEVYIDCHSPDRPQLGEVWYCQLLRKEIPGNHYYFALPRYKVESEADTKEECPPPDPLQETQSMTDLPGEESVDAIEDDGNNDLFLSENSGFVAIGDDTIYSPRLTAARYTVYRNFAGDKLELIPDDGGNVECVRNSIALESLDDILGCETPIRLSSECSEGRILLSLYQ